MNPHYDIFISYRRSDGAEVAQVVRHALQERGYHVFLDVRDLAGGPFDQALEKVIGETPDFVPILSRLAIQSDKPETDWFLKEVELALSANRNICPISTGALDLSQSQQLPAPLDRLRTHHTISYSHDYCDAAIDRLCQMLTKPPRKKTHGFKFLWGIGNWRTEITFGISLLAVCFMVGIVGLVGRQVRDVFYRNTITLGGPDASGGTATIPTDSMSSFDSSKNLGGTNNFDSRTGNK